MKIIQGRGNKRRTIIEMPTGDFVRRAPEEEQIAVRSFICGVTGVNPEMPATQPTA